MPLQTKPAIQQQLLADSRQFTEFADACSDTEFFRPLGDKWSVADVTQHLYLSARPVLKVMSGPKEVFLSWGTATGPSRAYEQIAAEYVRVLATGVKAPTPFVPRPEDMQVDKSTVLERFSTVYQSLAQVLEQWSEEELDTYCMLHPALGKITVREMLFFVSIHTHHHLRLLES